MTKATAALSPADFVRGVLLASVEDEALLLGHAHGEAVLLARHGHHKGSCRRSPKHEHGAHLQHGALTRMKIRKNVKPDQG